MHLPNLVLVVGYSRPNFLMVVDRVLDSVVHAVEVVHEELEGPVLVLVEVLVEVLQVVLVEVLLVLLLLVLLEILP